MNEKDLSKPTLTGETVQVTEVEELRQAIDAEYRTDHLTIPVVNYVYDEEAAEQSNKEREIILNGETDEETVVDDKGTTLRELRERYQFGIMPKDASEKAMENVGKHTISVEPLEDGTQLVVMSNPNDTSTKEEQVEAMKNLQGDETIVTPLVVAQPVIAPDQPVLEKEPERKEKASKD